MTAPNIGDVLLALGLVSEEDLVRAVELQRKNPNIRLGTLLVGLGAVGRSEVDHALEQQLTIRRGGLPPVKTTLALARHAVRVLGTRRS